MCVQIMNSNCKTMLEPKQMVAAVEMVAHEGDDTIPLGSKGLRG